MTARAGNLTLGLAEMLTQETLKGTRRATYRLQTNKWDSFYCLQGTDDSPLTSSLANCGYIQKTGKNNELHHIHYRHITFKQPGL
jgi:hypothetical protein